MSDETIDPDQARDLADDVLRRPEFRETRPSLVERIIDWFLDRIGELLNVIVGAGGGRVIGVVVLVAALLIVGYLVWRVAPRGRGQRRAAPKVTQRISKDPTRADWLDAAATAEEAGAWDEAVHARYHALTVGLADGDCLAADRSTTSGEHRRAFADRQTAAPADVARFDQVTERYETIWFGRRQASASDSRDAAADDHVLIEGER